MPTTEQEYKALENQLVEAGISRSVARSRVNRIKQGASGREIFNILFEDQMAKVAKDATDELFALKSPSNRALTFDKIIRKFLSYRGPRPQRGQARRNLEVLGLDEDWINWAVTKRIPFTPRLIAKQVIKLQRGGMSQEKAWREGIKLAAQDHIIEKAMRGGVTQLGDFGISGIIMIAALVAAVLAIIAWVVDLCMQGDLEDQEAKHLAERQNRPLTEIEMIELSDTMMLEDDWDGARAIALQAILAYREGRTDFVENEEKELKALWEEAWSEETEEEREERIERMMEATETDRIRRSGFKAAQRREALREAGASIIEVDARVARSRPDQTSRWLTSYGLPLVISGGLFAGLVILARR